MMKNVITITLALFMSIALFGQELTADDRVTITQSAKPYIGVYAFGYQGLPTPGFPQFQLNNYGGIPGTVAATADNSILGLFAFSGHNGSAKKTVGIIRVKSMDNFATNLSSRMDFLIGPNREQRMTILGDSGYVGIGTEIPTHKLDVNGQIRMQTGASTGYVPVSDSNGVMTWTDPSTFVPEALWGTDGSDVFRLTGNVSVRTGIVAIGLVSDETTTPSPLTILDIENPEIRLGNSSFNNKASGKIIFDENIMDGALTCGFEIEHDGQLDRLSIISGCQLPAAGDTLAIFPRNGYNKFPVRLMVGSQDNPISVLDVDGKITMREGAAAGYLPVSNANGTMTWTNPASIFTTTVPTEIRDNDGDTKIQVEESADQDIIRFDAGGLEIATMSSSRMGVRDNTPDYTFDLAHDSGVPGPTNGNGLNIQNLLSTTGGWTLYAWSSGNFSLHREGNTKGTFNGTSGVYTSASDRSLKKNIEELPLQMDKIMQLKPSTYQFKTQKDNSKHYGLISQEVQEIYPEFVSIIESVEEGGDEDLYGVSYASFVPVLIAGLQEQNQSLAEKDEAIEELNTRLSDLDHENKSLKNEVEELRLLVGQIQNQFTKYENDLQNCCLNSNADSKKESPITIIELNGKNQPQLEQNAPNPFNTETLIKYYIPGTATKAQLTITNINGTMLKSIQINEKGFGRIAIKAGELAAGTYAYTLFVDGIKIETKQMVLVK